MSVSRAYRLAARPVGLPTADIFELTEEPVGEPGDGELLVEVQYLSLDPAMRGWMNDAPSYTPPVGLGEVMRAIGVGRVVASRDDRYAEGDHVVGLLGVQEQAVVPANGLTKADPQLAPLPKWLGALGMPGLTAYFGLLEIGRPEPGQTVVVSAAAGAVGGLVGQIAKLQGARAVGIAGGPEKCAYITGELGFDAAIDYKNSDVARGLREACPQGIDVYFDNVGGEILDAALAQLAFRARVVICGAISQYNEAGPMRGPANYMSLLVNNASMTGFVVFHYASRYAEAARQMGEWVGAGKLKSREDVVTGIERFPEALLKLFEGTNSGKLVLAVGE
jgi:NADPH-dependent curcumin reductase CurA